MKRKHNDNERRQWVENDEGLYNLFIRNHRLSMTNFIRENRDLIDEVIENVVTGTKRAHYLTY